MSLPALAILLLSFPAHAAGVLMILEHSELGKPIETKIKVQRGMIPFSNKGRPLLNCTLRPGKSIKSRIQPGDRTVGFYRVTNRDKNLLFFVKVRYYRDHQGKWVPYFQFAQEPLISLDANGAPTTTLPSMSGAVLIVSNSLPNIDGYYPYLELTFSEGTVIDAWSVQ